MTAFPPTQKEKEKKNEDQDSTKVPQNFPTKTH